MQAAASSTSTPAPSVDPSTLEKPKHSTDSSGRVTEQTQDAAPTRPDTPEKAMPESEERERSAQEDDATEYPTAWRLSLITIAICLAVFCMALDNTIIATAIPRITDQFKALNDVGWYGSAYLLTTCCFQLIFGKLYTFYSEKWIFLLALFLFELGSLVCGVSPNSTALIIGRAIAGVGAAGLFSGAILIIARSVPLRKRPLYTGFIGGMYGIASVAGPLMGGAFTDRLTWRWCFYINLPFGAVTAVFILFFFPSPKKAREAGSTLRERIRVLDIEGTICFMPGVICLLLALQWGGSKYEWSNGRIIALFVLFGVLMIAFVSIQIWKQETATVPPRVFMNRNVWGSAFFGLCLGSSFFILVYYIPIWFQAIKGVSAVKSGIMNLPLILVQVIVSIIGGGVVTAIGYYVPFLYLSTILMSIGAGLLSTWTVDTAHPKWIGYQVIYGAGVGFGMQQTMIAIQASLPAADIAIGTAILMFCQTLGGALFISVAQNVFTNQLIKKLGQVSGVDPRLVLQAGATELQKAVPQQFLRQVLVAYNEALTETFYVSVAMAVLSAVGAAFVQWKSVKGKKIEMAAAA